MATILLNNFSGIYPRYGDTELQDNCAAKAFNVKLQSTEVRPWRKPVAVAVVQQTGVHTIFKMEGSGGAPIWCEWTADTDVCYGPIADQGAGRIYYSEGGVCKKTDYAMCTSGSSGAYPRDWRYMGVPTPDAAPVVTAQRQDPDDHENEEERVYAYTYVSEFSGIFEESAPSESATVTCDISGGSVTIKGFENPPTDHVNVVKIRLYRSVLGSSSVAFQLVDQFDLVNHEFPSSGVSMNGVPWSNSEYVDTRTTVQLGKDLDSLYYSPPPEGLRGLVSMPNGFLAGFVDNQVWFSEPYLPHAWPSAYMLTVDSPIVGLGVYGNTLVVCTSKQPYTISGTHPGAMAQEKQPMNQPCVSKRSIAYDQHGVLYASPYGLVAIAGGQLDVFTRPIVTQDEWAGYNPATMQSIMYNNLYMCAYRYGAKASMLVFHRADEPALVEYEFKPEAMFVERGSGRLFCLTEDKTIWQMDADPINMESYEWISKRFVTPYWTSFSAMKLDADYSANDVVIAWELQREEISARNRERWEQYEGQSLQGDINGALLGAYEVNGGVLESLPSQAEYRSVNVSIYADGKLIYSRGFDNIIAVRIPPVRAHGWQVRLSGTVNVRSFSMSTTMRELASPT